MAVKETDLVAVHPKWGTVHELKGRHKLACGNPADKIDYDEMRRKTANGKPNSKPCLSAACVKARVA